MKAAVRYYSRSGNTKLVADAMADALGIQAVSTDQPQAAITEKTDVLFIGGAIYGYRLDRNLREFLAGINPDMIGRAVVFSTSWISKHGLDLIRKSLQEKGIKVEKQTFYVKNKASKEQLRQAAEFAEKMSS